MDWNFNDIQWDIPQDTSGPPPPPPMPDNINWSNVLGIAGFGLQSAADYINPPAPASTRHPLPITYDGQATEGQHWVPQEGVDEIPNFGVQSPMPNVIDPYYQTSYNNDFNLPQHKYDSYWLDGPPLPPDPEFTPLENFQQNLWRGVSDYQYNDPNQMYQQGQETPPSPGGYQYNQPELPPFPFGQSW